jgi:hypothetical protein
MPRQPKEYFRAWRKKNPQKSAALARRNRANNPDTWENCRLKATYGITLAEKRELLCYQNGLCANQACCKKLTMKSAHVDHDHETERVRGLLCAPCNQAAGQVQDNPGVLRGLADYLDAIL